MSLSNTFIEKKISYTTLIEINDKSGEFIPYWVLAMKEHLGNNFIRVGTESNKSGVKSLRSFNIKLISKEDNLKLKKSDSMAPDSLFTIDVFRIYREKEINNDFVKYFKSTYNKNNFTVVLYTIDDVKDSTLKNCIKISDKIKSKTEVQEIIFLPYNTKDYGKLYAVLDNFFMNFKRKLSIEFTKQMVSLSKKLEEALNNKDLYEDPLDCYSYIQNKISYIDLLSMADYWEEIKNVCKKDLYKIFKGLNDGNVNYNFSEELTILNFDVNLIKKKIKERKINNIEYQQYLIYNVIRSCKYLKEYKKITNVLRSSAYKMEIYKDFHKSFYDFIYWEISYIMTSINYLNDLKNNVSSKDTHNILSNGVMNLLGVYSKFLKLYAEKAKLELPKIKIFYELKKLIDDSKDIKEILNERINQTLTEVIDDDNFKEFKKSKESLNSNLNQKILEIFSNKKSFYQEYLKLLEMINKNEKNKNEHDKNEKDKNHKEKTININEFSFRSIFEILPLMLSLGKFEEVKNILHYLLEHKFIKDGKFRYLYEFISFVLVLVLNYVEKNNDNLKLIFKLMNIKLTNILSFLKMIECDNQNLINEMISNYIETFNFSENNEIKNFVLDKVINIKLNKEKDDIIFINKTNNKTQQIKYKFSNNTGINLNIDKIELIFEEIDTNLNPNNIENTNTNNTNNNITYLIDSEKNTFKNINPSDTETEFSFDIEINNNTIFKNNTIYKFKEVHYFLKNSIYGIYNIKDEMKLCFNSMDMQVSTNIYPSFDCPKDFDEKSKDIFYYNVLSMIEINITNIPELSEFDDKTLKFQFFDISPKENDVLSIQHEVLNETIKKKYPGVIISKIGIEFPPGSLKDAEKLENIQVPFYIENNNFYSNGFTNIKISTTIEKDNNVLYSFFSYHKIDLIHLFNITKKFKEVNNECIIMQTTFSLNIETNKVKIYTHNNNDYSFYLDTTQAINLVLIFNNNEEETLKLLRTNFLEFCVDDNKKFRLCYPENNIIEEIKELKQVPYRILITVEEGQHNIFDEITVNINIKKDNNKNIVFLTKILENENWAIIGKSKIITDWKKEDNNEKNLQVKLMPLLDGFLKLPQIEFSEYEIKKKEDKEKEEKEEKVNNEILSEKLEFESIEFGSVIEGNEKVVKINPVTECTLKLNLT